MNKSLKIRFPINDTSNNKHNQYILLPKNKEVHSNCTSLLIILSSEQRLYDSVRAMPGGGKCVLCHVSRFVTLSHSSGKNTHFVAQSHRNFCSFFVGSIYRISGRAKSNLAYHHVSLFASSLIERLKYSNTMAFWKAAFAVLSLVAAVEGFTTPTVSRVSQFPRMTATLAEPDLGLITTENIRNIAGA